MDNLLGLKRGLFIGVAVFVAILLLVGLTSFIPISPITGQGDFQAYWSATYLLTRSQNFTDPALLLTVEQEKTGWTYDFVMRTWNPPWLLILLAPYTLVSYSHAAWLWFFTSIGLIFTASVWIWKVWTQQETWKHRAWIAPLVVFGFSPTLVSLLAGQVNVLVYFGLGAFLYFSKQNKLFIAGMGLGLTFVKPHLVYVVVPIILLTALKKRHWHLWVGFCGLLLVLTGITFALRPTFVMDFVQSITSGNLLSWETPTLGGFLTATMGWQWSKWIGIIVLPLIVVLWWRWFEQFDQEILFNIALLVSIMTAPFGWGYDAIILLLPLLQLVVWLVEGRYGRLETIVWLTLLLAIDGALFYQHSLGLSEMYFFWLPVMVTVLYSWMYRRQQVRLQAIELASIIR